MEISKTATALLLLIVSTSSSVAGNLCDAACTLTIDYPDGGSIDAVESLTITFGTDGLVDTIGSVTSYLDAETLVLNVGESLTFEAGGSFDIGTEGNIDYTDMTFNGGIIEISVMGGAETIEIPAGATLLFSGASLSVDDSNLNVEGSLNLGNASEFWITGHNWPSGCSLVNSSGANLTIGNGSALTIDSITPCNDITANVGLVAGVSITNVVGGTITVVGGALTAAGGTLTLTPNDTVDGGEPVTDESTADTTDIADETGGTESSNEGSDGVFGAAVSPGFPALLFAIFLLISVSRRLAAKPR